MCVHLRRILNRKIDFDVVNDKRFLYVPCGHCEECRAAHQFGYAFRCFYHWQKFQSIGGVTFFYTLTFNNYNLPYYDNIQCFDKKLVQRFLKRLSARLYRAGYGKLDYFLSSEFGEKKHRPHHHVLFFVPSKISPSVFRKILAETWCYGLIKEGDNFGVVRDSNAVRYVCKYVSKDIDFIKKFPSTIPQESLSNILPFHLQSQGLGLYAFDCMSDFDRKFGTIKLPNQSQTSFVSTILPTYLLRKFYYVTIKNSNGTNSYVLNEKGVERKVAYFPELRQTTLDKYLDHLCSIPEDKEFREEFDLRLQKLFGTTDFRLIVDTILSNSGNSMQKLVDYHLVYRGRLAVLPPLDTFEDFKYFLSDKDNSLPFDSSANNQLYGDLPCYEHFDNILLCFDFIDTWFRYKRYRQKVLKYNSIQRQRVAAGCYKHVSPLPLKSFHDYVYY